MAEVHKASKVKSLSNEMDKWQLRMSNHCRIVAIVTKWANIFKDMNNVADWPADVGVLCILSSHADI
jgi:hypothetical protein